MPAAHRHAKTPPRLAPAHRRRVILVIVATQAVLALLTATLVYVGWNHLDHNITSDAAIRHQVTKQDAGPQEPLNILLLGSDTRAGQGDAIDTEKGGGSDTTILVHVAADRRSAYGISIPRDALVEPEQCTANAPHYVKRYVGGAITSDYTDKLLWNEAYAVGGPECTAEQVESNFGVFVDDYIVVDFAGFKAMVDHIGGVDVCIPQVIDDPKYSGAHFDPGPAVHLNGDLALQYVRVRHGIGDGTDIGRMRRQQSFIAAVIDKVSSAGTLSDPTKLYGFANSLTKSISTNPEIAHVSSLVRLAQDMQGVDLTHIKFVSVPSHLVPVGQTGYPHVALDPSAKTLMRRVSKDESLGPFAKTAIKAGHHKHAAQSGQSTEDGLCA
jgi:LCP family protein required for cell wall assembly